MYFRTVSLFILALLLFYPTNSYGRAQFSGWQMCDPIGGKEVYHGGYGGDDNLLFSFAPNPDNEWVVTPDPEQINYFAYSNLYDQPVIRTWYTWFYTLLYLPPNSNSLWKMHSERDDALAVLVNNEPMSYHWEPWGNVGYQQLPTLNVGINKIVLLHADTAILGYVRQVWFEDILTGEIALYNPVVPEPTSLLVLGAGVAGISILRRDKS